MILNYRNLKLHHQESRIKGGLPECFCIIYSRCAATTSIKFIRKTPCYITTPSVTAISPRFGGDFLPMGIGLYFVIITIPSYLQQTAETNCFIDDEEEVILYEADTFKVHNTELFDDKKVS